MEQVFKMVMKVFLLLTGIVMLLGGGICAVSNTYLMFANYRAEPLFLLLLGLSCLIAWAGWAAIKFSGIGQSRNSDKSVDN
jgi:hypothetical protein